MVLNSPKCLDTVFRWKKQTPKVQLNIQVFFKENLTKLKTRFRHFQFFPLVLNHITYQHMCAQRVHTHTHPPTHRRTHTLSHETEEKQGVTQLQVVYREARQRGRSNAHFIGWVHSRDVNGTEDVHRTEASLKLQRRQILELLAWQWTTSNYKKVFTFIN